MNTCQNTLDEIKQNMKVRHIPEMRKNPTFKPQNSQPTKQPETSTCTPLFTRRAKSQFVGRAATQAVPQPALGTCPSSSTRSQLAHTGKRPHRSKGNSLKSSSAKISPQHKPGHCSQTSYRQEAGTHSPKCRTRAQRSFLV